MNKRPAAPLLPTMMSVVDTGDSWFSLIGPKTVINPQTVEPDS